MMQLSLIHSVLLCVWNFLGAEFITTDIHLALQSHAVERKFKQWFFHILLHEELRHCAKIPYQSWPLHPRLTERLQGAIELLFLRSVNRDLQRRCTNALTSKGIVLHDLVYASRPVRSLTHYINNLPLLEIMLKKWEAKKIAMTSKIFHQALFLQHKAWRDLH